MATQVDELEILDSIEMEINQTVDRLIQSLNLRRNQLLAIYRDKREEMRASLKAREDMRIQLKESKGIIDGAITHNLLNTMQSRIAEELDTKMADLENTPLPQLVKFHYDTKDLEILIANLGLIQNENVQSPPVPPRFHKHPICFAFQSAATPAIPGPHTGPEEFICPQAISVQADTGHIFVADSKNLRIEVFSQTGRYLDYLGQRYLSKPYGVLAHKNRIYVTDIGLHTLFLFTLPEITMPNRVGKLGHGKDDFNSPRQLALSQDKLIHVTDCQNDRIQILDLFLNFKKPLQHSAMIRPLDIKFSANRMFVLCRGGSHAMHIFTLAGEMVQSILSRGSEGQFFGVWGVCFFCLDGQNNIVVSEYGGCSLRVFSTDGDLKSTIEEDELSHAIPLLNHPKLVFV